MKYFQSLNQTDAYRNFEIGFVEKCLYSDMMSLYNYQNLFIYLQPYNIYRTIAIPSGKKVYCTFQTNKQKINKCSVSKIS